jgi:hypothetical protein
MVIDRTYFDPTFLPDFAADRFFERFSGFKEAGQT